MKFPRFSGSISWVSPKKLSPSFTANGQCVLRQVKKSRGEIFADEISNLQAWLVIAVLVAIVVGFLFFGTFYNLPKP